MDMRHWNWKLQSMILQGQARGGPFRHSSKVSLNGTNPLLVPFVFYVPPWFFLYIKHLGVYTGKSINLINF